MKKSTSFALWGLFLLAFPAIAGALFAAGLGAPSFIGMAVQISYMLWGWLPALIGLGLLVRAMAYGAESSDQTTQKTQDDSKSENA